MKRKNLILSLLSSLVLFGGLFSTAQAGTYEIDDAEPEYGFYIGVSGGYGDNHWDDVISSIDSGSFAMRGTLGYQFTKYYAKEFGFTYFFETDDIETWTIDLASRIMIPVMENVSVFGKWGISYMHSDISFAGSSDAFNATFGAGVMYDFGNDFIVEASWQRFGGDQDFSEFQPFADYFSIGVIYKLTGWLSS